MEKVLLCHAKVPKCITLISIHTYADKQHNCTLPCLYPTHPSYRPPTLMSGKEGWCQLLSKLQPVNTSPSPPPCSRLVRQGQTLSHTFSFSPALPLPDSASEQHHLLPSQLSRSARLQPRGDLSFSLPSQDCSGCSSAKFRIRIRAGIRIRIWAWKRIWIPMGS